MCTWILSSSFFPKNILSLVINNCYKNVALFLGSPRWWHDDSLQSGMLASMFIWKELENVPQMFFQSLFISSYKTSYMLLFIAIVSLPHWGHDNERVIKYMLTHIDFLGLHEASKKIQNTYNIKFLRSRWMQHLNKWFGNLYASHLLQYVAIDPCMDGFSFFKTNVL